MAYSDFLAEGFVPYAVTVNTGPTVKIKAITDVRLSPGLQQLVLGANSGLEPTFAAVGQEDPRIGLTTLDLAGALDLTGLSPLAIPFGSDGLDVWFAKLDAAGIASGSVHTRLRVMKGIVFPGPLNMRFGRQAMMGVEVVPIDPGDGTDPVVVTGGLALPTLTVTTLGVSDVWTLGPAYLNGGLMDGTLEEVTISPGIGVQPIRGGGKTAPKAMAAGQKRFQITGRTKAGKLLTDVKLRTGAISGTTRFFAQKMSQGSSLVPWTGTGNDVHIKFDLVEGTIALQDVSARHAELTGIPFIVTPTRKDEGTPQYVAVDTTSFIDAV